MNYGPLVFLAALFAMATSWLGFVLAPQMQIGQLQQTNTVPATVPYPASRPGLAQQGWTSIAKMAAFTVIASRLAKAGQYAKSFWRKRARITMRLYPRSVRSTRILPKRTDKNF